jgi:hypothetical protein
MRIITADDNNPIRYGVKAILPAETLYEVFDKAADRGDALLRVHELNPPPWHTPLRNQLFIAIGERIEFLRTPLIPGTQLRLKSTIQLPPGPSGKQNVLHGSGRPHSSYAARWGARLLVGQSPDRLIAQDWIFAQIQSSHAYTAEGKTLRAPEYLQYSSKSRSI